MFKAVIYLKTHDNDPEATVELFSGLPIRWRIQGDKDLWGSKTLVVLGEFDEIAVPYDNVRNLHIYQQGAAVG